MDSNFKRFTVDDDQDVQEYVVQIDDYIKYYSKLNPDLNVNSIFLSTDYIYHDRDKGRIDELQRYFKHEYEPSIDIVLLNVDYHIEKFKEDPMNYRYKQLFFGIDVKQLELNEYQKYFNIIEWYLASMGYVFIGNMFSTVSHNIMFMRQCNKSYYWRTEYNYILMGKYMAVIIFVLSIIYCMITLFAKCAFRKFQCNHKNMIKIFVFEILLLLCLSLLAVIYLRLFGPTTFADIVYFLRLKPH